MSLLWLGSFLALGLLAGACSSARAPLPRAPQSGPAINTVFFNSFESSRDTLSWYWMEAPVLAADVPAGGGNRSLRISGGRMLPTGCFISQPLRAGGYFTIQCWGKMAGAGGVLELATIANHDIVDAVQVPIVEPQWTLLQAGEVLYCPPNNSLMISLQAGGTVQGGMLVDLIQIKKVKKVSAVKQNFARVSLPDTF